MKIILKITDIDGYIHRVECDCYTIDSIDKDRQAIICRSRDGGKGAIFFLDKIIGWKVERKDISEEKRTPKFNADIAYQNIWNRLNRLEELLKKNSA